jgi:hypothetical protein
VWLRVVCPLAARLPWLTVCPLPEGCFVASTQEGFEAFFNLQPSKAQCGLAAGARVRSTGSETVSSVDLKLDLDEGGGNCSQPKFTSNLAGQWRYSGQAYGPHHNKAAPYTVTWAPLPGRPEEAGAWKLTGGPCSPHACTATVTGSSVTVDFRSDTMKATIDATWGTLTFANGVPWTKVAPACPGLATITMSGPSASWFGVGFDASTMADKPYAIVVAGGSGQVSEHRLGNHEKGTAIAASLKVVSSVVANGKRTVVLQRPLRGATPQHLTFKASATGLPIIAAVGDTPTLAYHRSRAGGSLMLVEVGAPLCVCPAYGTASGSIAGVHFNNHCAQAPRSTLLTEHNDVCDITTYEGGLKCCAHKSILLDKNQTPAAGPSGPVDTYRMKFRLYFEEYAGQDNAFFMFVANEAGAGEYDIPQAKPGEEPVHTLTGNFKVRDSMRRCASRSDVWCAPGWNESSRVALLRAGTHCHAPACINETLYNMDTNPPTVLCFNEPLYGEGEFPESGQSFNEAGYAVGIPPCFWGSEEEGLRPSPILSLDTNLRSVKHVNNTFYHYGVMAQWQMRGKWVHQS